VKLYVWKLFVNGLAAMSTKPTDEAHAAAQEGSDDEHVDQEQDETVAKG
jgi:hypothetical protein